MPHVAGHKSSDGTEDEEADGVAGVGIYMNCQMRSLEMALHTEALLAGNLLLLGARSGAALVFHVDLAVNKLFAIVGVRVELT